MIPEHQRRLEEHFDRVLALLGFDKIDLVERQAQYMRAKELSSRYRKTRVNLDAAPQEVREAALALHQYSQLVFEYERILRKEKVI